MQILRTRTRTGLAGRSLLTLALCFALLSAYAPTAAAVPSGATYTANSFRDTVDANPGDGICADSTPFSDGGPKCTLRAAIMEANAHASANITIILPRGTYTLSLAGRDENAAATGDLDILQSVTIIGSNGNADGPGSNTVIDAAGIDRVFEINPYGNKVINATFKALTIQQGTTTGDNNYAGGIYYDAADGTSTTSAGHLYIYNCVIANNKTSDAGGFSGGLFLVNATGAASALTTIEKSVITGNTSFVGGGISSDRMPLVIRDSTISGNSSTGDGGGLMASGGSITIQRSTFSGNSVEAGQGGGIFTRTDLTMENSTISGNTAAAGGGIAALAGNFTLTNVTIANNQARSGGGGIKKDGSLTLRNTIVYGNAGPASGEIIGNVDPASSFNNLVGRIGDGGLTDRDNGNLVGADPKLGPLANNGGPTQTHKLLAGSAARDAGNNDYVAGTVDQRGHARIVDVVGETPENTTATVDIGAYELNATIETIANQSGEARTTIDVPVTVAGMTTTVTASSSNPSVVPNDAAHLHVVNPTSTAPTVQVTGALAGTSVITVTVTSDGESATSTFSMTVTGTPDLTISKSHKGDFTQGQRNAGYTLLVRNSGTDQTSGTVTLTDSLPPSLTPTAATAPADWRCMISGQDVTCTTDTVMAPDHSYAPITLKVDVDPLAPASLSNTATIEGGNDTTPGNNSATDVAKVLAAPDLTVRKRHDGALHQGQTAVYKITVSNVGGPATKGAVAVADTLPQGLTARAISGQGWICNLKLLNCGRSDPLAAGQSYPDITLTVNVLAGAPAALTNVARVSGGGDVNTGNNSASDEATVGAEADLTIRASHDGDFTQGRWDRYTLAVHNGGLGPTTGTVTVRDQLPAGISYMGVNDPTFFWTCGAERQTVTCTSSQVVAAGGDSPVIRLLVQVAANAPPMLTNQAEVSGGGDRNTANNRASDETRITALVDLTIARSQAGSFTQGETYAFYFLTVTNIGIEASSGEVTVVDRLPAGLIPHPWSDNGWTCTIDDQTFTCSRSDALAALSRYPSITVVLEVSARAAASVTNVAEVSGGGDTTPANNKATDPTTVTQLADLSVTMRHSGAFRPGHTGEYTLVVKNLGRGETDGAPVSVTDNLPTGLTVNTLSGSGWTCAQSTPTCTRSDKLAPGRSYSPITVVVQVAPDAQATVTNVAQVSGGGQIIVDNDSASDPTTLGQVADLTLTTSHVGNFVRGLTGTYTLTVKNAGSGATDAPVTVSDKLPKGMMLLSMSGVGWACNPATATCTRSDVLGAGRSYPVITLKVSVSPGTAPSVTNEASVAGGGETDGSNNTASDPTTIVLATPAPVPPPRRRP